MFYCFSVLWPILTNTQLCILKFEIMFTFCARILKKEMIFVIKKVFEFVSSYARIELPICIFICMNLIMLMSSVLFDF